MSDPRTTMRTLAVLVIPVLAACNGGKSVETKPDAADVIEMQAHDISPPLTELAKLPNAERAVIEHEAEPARPIPHRQTNAPIVADPNVQNAFGIGAIPT